MRQVLVVEDQRDVAGLIESALRGAGYGVRLAFDARSALAHASAKTFDLIILDLSLPDGDGLILCRALRDRGDFTPVIMLTGRASEQDRVAGLDGGADDYVTKPFAMPELMARVRSQLRRVAAITQRVGQVAEALVIGTMSIDPAARAVMIDGNPVPLTAKEFELLLHLARTPGQVHTRESLLDLVWGYRHRGHQHVVNSHINRLRAKIERDPANPVFVRTVWGIGYAFGGDAVAAS